MGVYGEGGVQSRHGRVAEKSQDCHRSGNEALADWANAPMITPKLHPVLRMRLLSEDPVSIQDATGHRGDFT